MHHDALEFPAGRMVLVNHLCGGESELLNAVTNIRTMLARRDFSP
jgi:hypothetical protein